MIADNMPKILDLLRDGPKTAQELQEALGLSQRAVSHLLTRLNALHSIHSTRPAREAHQGRPPAVWHPGKTPKTLPQPADQEGRHPFATARCVLDYMTQKGQPTTIVEIATGLGLARDSIYYVLRRLHKKGLIIQGEQIPNPCGVDQARPVYLWAIAPGVDAMQSGKKTRSAQILEKITQSSTPLTTIQLETLLGVARNALENVLTKLRKAGNIDRVGYVSHPTKPGKRIAAWWLHQTGSVTQQAAQPPKASKKFQPTQDDLEWMEQWRGHKAKKMASVRI
jgi:predicted transcriptional regulator